MAAQITLLSSKMYRTPLFSPGVARRILDLHHAVLVVISVLAAILVHVVMGDGIAPDGRVAVRGRVHREVDGPIVPQGLIAGPVAKSIHHKQLGT